MALQSHVRRSPEQVAAAISDILADAGAELVASLPDGWIAPLIKHLAQDTRFRHIPVNREEFLTCIYAITKINYTYQIPLLFLITLRGAPGDTARYHVSNGLYLRSVIEAIDMPALYLERCDELPKIADAYRHASVLARPYVVALGRELLKGTR
jgi:sulfopyruvate decarboxylase subunit alpha